MTHPPSRLCLSDIRRGVPCKFRASTIYAALPRRAASYPLPVRQAGVLPSASSRFAVTHDTLAVQLALPLAGRAEDFHLQVSAPCRAHIKKARGHMPPGLTSLQHYAVVTSLLQNPRPPHRHHPSLPRRPVHQGLRRLPQPCPWSPGHTSSPPACGKPGSGTQALS